MVCRFVLEQDRPAHRLCDLVFNHVTKSVNIFRYEKLSYYLELSILEVVESDSTVF